MSIILDKFPDILTSRSNSSIGNISQKSNLNLQNSCFICSPTQQNCSHRNRGCPDHPAALLVQDFNHEDYLCSVCGCSLTSEGDEVNSKRHKTHHSSDASRHNLTSTAATTTNSSLSKQLEDPSTTLNSVSSVKSGVVHPMQNDALTVSPQTLITPTTITAVVTPQSEKQESTMVQHVEQQSSQLALPPPQSTKTGKPKKKSTRKPKKAALLMKQQLATGASGSLVANAASDPSLLEPNNNSKTTSPTDVQIKTEPTDPDEVTVTATTMGSNNIPALTPWPYKMEKIDSGHSSTSSSPPATATTNASKKKVTYSVAKALVTGITKLEQLANDISAPMSLVQNATALFKKVYESGLLRNRPVDIIVSTCLYITCRQEGVPRTFQEIAQLSKVSKKELGRSFKVILKLLDTPVDVITTKDFMCRFCHVLGLQGELMEAAQHIATEAAKLDLVAGRSPVSVAAAAIYVATQASSEPRTASDIGVASGVSEATIFSVYRCIYPHARELFPPNFRFHTSIENLPTQRVAFS